MAYQDGFTYVSGPIKYVLSVLSSTCTVRGRNPVTLSDDRSVIEAKSDSTAIYGIAAHNAADSIIPGYMLVEIPTPETVYAAKVQTGVAASQLSVGESHGIEKSGNFLRVDVDSTQTQMVTIVPRGNYATHDSNDSSIFVHFLGNVLGVFNSNASVLIFDED